MSEPEPIRVMVQDVWDEIRLPFEPARSVAELKRQALAATRVRRSPDEYLVKFRGAEVLDEAGSLADAGVMPNANLIILPRRRRPVR